MIMVILSIIGTAILLGGLIVGFRQLVLVERQVHIMTEQMQSQLDWNRMNATFDYIAKFRSELEETNLILQEKFKLLLLNGTPLNPSHIEEVRNDDKARVHLFYLVSYCDQLALGISQGYFSEFTAFESLCVSVTSVYKSLVPYIEMRRKETGVNVAGHFETLSKRWIDKMQADPRLSPVQACLVT